MFSNRMLNKSFDFHKKNVFQLFQFCCFSKSTSSTTLFSGFQPTGIPHIGNYLGSLKSFVEKQNDSNKAYCSIVDLHAITSDTTPKELYRNIQTMIATLLACGLNPNKCVIFQQSMIPQHSELMWIFNCLTLLSSLERMTQFKVKKKNREGIKSGLLMYPILMASDILLYETTHVLVGEDQSQHIELARDIAKTFNEKYQTDLFKSPLALVGNVRRLRNLRNPESKMSKSEKENGRIGLLDSDDEISYKIQKAITDCDNDFSYNPLLRPGLSNLIDIYSGLTKINVEDVVERNKNTSKSDFKKILIEALIHEISPIRKVILSLNNQQDYIDSILKKGAEEAHRKAFDTMEKVKRLIGFLI